MVKLTHTSSGHPDSVEAELTDVDLPAVVNYGVGRNETEAIADLKQRVAGYLRSLEHIDYTVLRS